MKIFYACITWLLFFSACNSNKENFDASGTFEADEVVVPSMANGKILSLKVSEGSVLGKDSIVGLVDPADLNLQKEEIEASIQTLKEQTLNVQPKVRMLEDQLAVQQTQLDNALHEKERIERLLKQDAATGKQLDDINLQVDMVQKQMSVTKQQIQVQRTDVGTQNTTILSQGKPMQKRVELMEDRINKTQIKNPINGTVLVKYAEEGEMTSSGKALYSIADLSSITLRAYISGSQLSQVKLNQQVTVLVDDGKDKYKRMTGTVTWISDKAEFTPKTIQTKDERANLVYAIKVKVNNDGYLKIGMYGEVKFAS